MSTEPDRRNLSGIESLMWRLGSEPGLRSTFGAACFLDATPDRDLLARRVAEAVRATPHFRQRVAASRVPGMPPTWVDDDAVDLDSHVRWDEPDAGVERTDDEVLQMGCALVAAPFDDDRPMWDLVVATGLRGGRAALLVRIHHVLADGQGGIAFFERILDTSADQPPDGATPDPFPGGPAVEPPATWGERAAITVAERVGALARSTAGAARWTIEGVADPARFTAAADDAAEVVRSLQRQLLVLDRARSRLWTARSADRRLVVASVPFDAVRDAASAAGVTVNDIFVTAVARAVGTYHRVQGRPLVDLRVVVPVSTRRGAASDGNAVAPVRTVVPSGEGLTAAAHLIRVADRLTAATAERSTSIVGTLAGVGELVPQAALTRVFARQAATIDVVASNVGPAPSPLYLAGARVAAAYPLGPLMATPANITLITYDGRADLGIHVDPVAVTEPELLRDNLIGALNELTMTERTD